MRRKQLKIFSYFVTVLLVSLACSLSAQPPGSPPGALFADASPPADAAIETDVPPTVTSTASPVNLTTTSVSVQEPATEIAETFTPGPTAVSPEATGVRSGQTETPPATSDPDPVSSATPTTINHSFTSPLENATLKLTDNFNGGGTFVTASVENSYLIGYTDTTFQIEIFDPEIDVWVIRSQNVNNVRQEIDFVAGEGAEDGFVGLICRWDRSSVYYRFTASLGGELKITKVYLNILTDLAQAQRPEFSPAEDRPVRLRADCSGTNLYMYLNGELTLTAEDDDIPIGKVGLIAGTSGGGPVTFELDNYALYYR